MTSGSLTDLDPAVAPERRWPFYLGWTVGGVLVGAVLFTHLPAGSLPAETPIVAPEPTVRPIVTQPPGPPRFGIPLPVTDPRQLIVPTRP